MSDQIEREVMKKIKADLKAADFLPEIAVGRGQWGTKLRFNDPTNDINVAFYIENGRFTCHNSGFIPLADPDSFKKMVAVILKCHEYGMYCAPECPLESE